MMGTTRQGCHRLSSVDRLPSELRERLKRAVADATMTVDQLHATANEGRERISRSAIGRFKRREERALKKPDTADGVVLLYLQLPPVERERFQTILRILSGGAK